MTFKPRRRCDVHLLLCMNIITIGDHWNIMFTFISPFFLTARLFRFFSHYLSCTKLVHTSSTIEICLVHKHYLIQTKNLWIWFASFVFEAMARRQKPTNACTSFIDGLIVDIGCPHQKIDRRLSRRWTNDDWGSTSEKLGFEGAEARLPGLTTTARTLRGRRADAANVRHTREKAPSYAAWLPRHTAAAVAKTHERRRKRYFTAVLLTAAEVLRDIRWRTEAAELNWVKDIPAAFDDSGVARSCLNPQLFNVDDYAKYTILHPWLLIQFQILPSF